jgi:hypothetical protein
VSKINKLTLSFGAVQQNEGQFGSASVVAFNCRCDEYACGPWENAKIMSKYGNLY